MVSSSVVIVCFFMLGKWFLIIGSVLLFYFTAGDKFVKKVRVWAISPSIECSKSACELLRGYSVRRSDNSWLDLKDFCEAAAVLLMADSGLAAIATHNSPTRLLRRSTHPSAPGRYTLTQPAVVPPIAAGRPPPVAQRCALGLQTYDLRQVAIPASWKRGRHVFLRRARGEGAHRGLTSTTTGWAHAYGPRAGRRTYQGLNVQASSYQDTIIVWCTLSPSPDRLRRAMACGGTNVPGQHPDDVGSAPHALRRGATGVWYREDEASAAIPWVIS